MDDEVTSLGNSGVDSFTPPGVMDLIRSLQDRVAALEAAQTQRELTDPPSPQYMIRQITTHLTSQREAP